MRILITGGLGYIGSHICAVLAKNNHEVFLLDNLFNSKTTVLNGIAKIIGRSIPFIEGDIRNTSLLVNALRLNSIDAVVHCAGLKAVGESVSIPLNYYENNVSGTVSLLNAMSSCNVKKLVFSSSATIYGHPLYLPLDEKHPVSPINPYGNTKAQIETILKDLANSDSQWKILCLRYFNPVGAHETGFIGESPNGIPNNLMPYLAMVAAGQMRELLVYGDDYMTHDGTGVRDYIHIMDLAEGHARALARIENFSGWSPINLGTGKGYSVLELIKAFETVSSREIKYRIVARRSGDLDQCFANVDKALNEIDWKARFSIEDMCKSVWKWIMLGGHDLRN